MEECDCRKIKLRDDKYRSMGEVQRELEGNGNEQKKAFVEV
jgi:hypothetical protein